MSHGWSYENINIAIGLVSLQVVLRDYTWLCLRITPEPGSTVCKENAGPRILSLYPIKESIFSKCQDST